MDYNNYDRGYAEPAMTSADYMSRTYRWMACGLLVTFAAAFVTATTPCCMWSTPCTCCLPSQSWHWYSC